MNKRQRKKQLKKLGTYVPSNEVWNLDVTICDWIIPRLKKFKELNIAYPGVAPYDTFEKWQAAIDVMIHSFEMARFDPIDDEAGLDLFDENCKLKVDNETLHQRVNAYNSEIEYGLKLFAKWFRHLWI